MSEEQRRYARFLTDLDLTLWGSEGSAIDESAQASDLSPVGFRATTSAELKIGDRLRFTLKLDEGEKIEGVCEVVWVNKDGWGTQTAGFKFHRIPWGAKRMLRQAVPVERYDFVGLAKIAGLAVYWTVIVAAVHNVMFHQPWARQIAGQLMPIIGAVVVLSLGLFMLVW